LVSENDKILYIVPIGTRTNKGEPLLRKTLGELEQIFSYEEEEEEEITAGQYIRKSPGGTVVDIDVYSNVDISKFPLLKELAARTSKKYKVTPEDKFTVRGNVIKGVLVKFKVEQELYIKAGDKLCNRYGNKGIISLIEKEENMPRTPWGESVEIILNPIGIINRMNVGQLYELYCGLISKTLATKIVEYNNQPKAVQLLKLVLPKLDNTDGKKISNGVISYVAGLSSSGFKTLINQIRTFGFVPIIVPPFKSPKLDQVMDVLKVLNLKASYHLHLPEYNVKTQHPVPVGYAYASKLEHIGEMKIYGRSTGPVTGKTGQPTSGKRREGGQRLGEQDTYSLISYNCPALLAEFLGPLSDDAVSKNEIVSDIIQRGHAEFRIAKVSPVKDLLTSYFISLMLERY
jgi:DNA-directed RNA polymerase subunit beta